MLRGFGGLEQIKGIRYVYVVHSIDGYVSWYPFFRGWQSVQVDFTPILSINDIPSGVAIHGTNLRAWQSICKLPRYSRSLRWTNVRDISQRRLEENDAESHPFGTRCSRSGQRYQWYAIFPIFWVSHSFDLTYSTPGMRTSSQILIYIDVEKALADGIKFFMSANGVVLTEGNPETGVLSTKYFKKVENPKRQTLEVWGSEGQSGISTDSPAWTHFVLYIYIKRSNCTPPTKGFESLLFLRDHPSVFYTAVVNTQMIIALIQTLEHSSASQSARTHCECNRFLQWCSRLYMRGFGHWFCLGKCWRSKLKY